MERAEMELHGHSSIPRGVPLRLETEANEFGTVFRHHWFPARPEDEIVFILSEPEDCSCDACRGITSILEQHVFHTSNS